MVKKKSKKICGNWLCSLEDRSKCPDEITDKHHLFSQGQQARRRYGKLLDEPFNLIDISNRCHLWHPIPTYSEMEFIMAGEKEGFAMLKLAGKDIQFKIKQGKF